ncbi:Aldo/keto reductase family-domain-containing protein [Melanogaster broomeanus]|nr:Aldo/keto reductase family-domain-containing protein [Melanogaster broomeanus]
MVERLDAPQPTFPLPPLAEIPDEGEDKPKDGNSDMPAVIFGAASFSRFYNDDDHISGVTPLRATRLALRYGINAFDTAPYYGPSEIVLGNALKALENEFPRSSYQLFTKCGRFGNTRDTFDYTPDGVCASVQRSLKRMHTTYLDTVYVHDVEFIDDYKLPRTSGDHRSALGPEAAAYGLGEGQEAIVYGDGDREILAAVAELRRQQEAGVVRRVGISGYPLPTLLRLAILVKNTAPYTPLDVVAFEQRAGVKQVISASPLSMGLLTPTPPAWHPASDNIKEAVKEAVELAKASGAGLPELALQYAFQKAREAEIPTVVGLSSLKDVHENARIWYEIDKLGVGETEGWKGRLRAVTDLFEKKDGGLLDHSWETPKFAS